MHFKDRIGDLRRRIGLAAARSGRDSSAVRLVAATKMVPPAIILEAAGLGISDIGENKVQEALAKRDSLGSGPALTHHFIGQLQTNKARRAVELFDMIQSVDRPRLAEALDRAAIDARKRQRCLIEVRISDDAEKGGAPLADAKDFAQSFPRYRGLQLEGLMGIAPYDATVDQTRAAFQELARLFHDLRDCFGREPILSMGMSDDFETAIEEGSTMVRIGTALFGSRA